MATTQTPARALHIDVLVLLMLASLVTLQYENNLSYCNKTRARAGNEAALLMAPELVTQAFRFPATAFDPALAGGAGNLQLRVGAAISLSDLYRGVRVMSAAAADCRQHNARQRIERVLVQGPDAGRGSAVRKQLDYLLAHQARWRELSRKAEERFAAHVITFVDLHDLRKRAWTFDRMVTQMRSELMRLQDAGASESAQGVDALVAKYVAHAAEFEDESMFVRALSAWQLRLSGGVVPLQATNNGLVAGIDWYGLVEVRLNLGVFSSSDDYLRAREAELRTAEYEVPARVQHFISSARASLDASFDELQTVRQQVESTRRARDLVEHSDAPKAGHAAALLELDEIQFEADRVYLEALIMELQPALGENHG